MSTAEGTVDVAAATWANLRAHMSPALALAAKFAGQGAVEAGGSGCEVTLSDGRTALDFGSYAVTLLGHRNPAVVEAVRAQLDIMPTSTRSLGNPVAASAAREIVEYLGPDLPRVYFGLNGADAVEVAIKCARLATGRTKVIAVRGGYHGKSMGALALTHHSRFRDGLTDLLGGVAHVDPADPDAVGRHVRDGDVAALVFEPVQAENGVRPLDQNVLRGWCDDAKKAGAMVISDEIQVGLRRCGARSVALDAGLPVDGVLLGKPLGGGVVPLSAMVASDRLYQPLLRDPFRHTATFGGQPLCVAAVPAALSAIEANARNGELLADVMAAELSALRALHPQIITDVRGRGLLWGVDFARPELAGEVQIGLAQRGLLVSPCLSNPQTLRLLPPIVATPDQVRHAVRVLAAAVDQAKTTFGAPGES